MPDFLVAGHILYSVYYIPVYQKGCFSVCLCMKELLKKSQRCMEVIIDAKERQAAEANKNATILLQEIDLEKVSQFCVHLQEGIRTSKRDGKREITYMFV